METTAHMTHKASLTDRIKGAASWTVGGHVSAQMIKLASNLVMTQLLVPADFGLMAVVGVLLVGLTLLSDIGAAQNIISNQKGADQTFRHTLWTLQIVRGCGTWLLACLFSLGLWAFAHASLAPTDSVYADPRLPWVVVTFLQSIIQGFTPTKVAIAQRDIKVRELILLRVFSQLIALVPMVVLGWVFRSVWALVFGGLAAILAQVVLSYLMVPGEADKLCWNRQVLREVWQFGRWIMMSSLIGFLASCGDRLLLGTYLSAEKLGLYSIAVMLLAPLQSIFTILCSSVAFPAISEVYRTKPQDYTKTYVKFQHYTDVLSVGGAAMLIMAGPEVVRWLYRAHYHSAGPLLSVLAVGLIGMRFYVVEQCYMVAQKPHLLTMANGLRLAALCLMVPAGYAWQGIDGAVWGVGLSTYAAWPLALWFRAQHHQDWWKADTWVLPLVAAGVAMGWMVEQGFHALPRWH